MKSTFNPAILLCVLFPLWGLTACKKTEQSEPQPAQSPETPSPEIDTKAEGKAVISLDEALKVIKEQKNLTITEVKNGRIYIQNKYNKLKLDLSPQDVQDKKYELLALDGPEYLEKNTLGSTPTPTWGKTPKWIPRYPKAEILPNAMHSPLKDGSIWGNINFFHSDPMPKVCKYLIEQFTARKMIIATNVQQKDSRILVFQNPVKAKEEAKEKSEAKSEEEFVEKRRVTITIKKFQSKTKVSLQYSYGMP